MATMGKYCKAYEVKALRAFPQWREDVSALAKGPLGDEDVLYVQESLIVTDGIFKDEHVVFSDVDEAWKTFCRDTLHFQVPEWHNESAVITSEGAKS